MARSLLKRTQVRTAIAYTIMFAIIVVLLSSALVLTLAEELEEGIESRVLRTRDTLVMIDRRFGFDELVNVVTDEAESVRDTDSIFTVVDNEGNVQAGNVRTISVAGGWQNLAPDALPATVAELHQQGRFFAVWAPVSKGMLMVGRSDREAHQAKNILIQSLIWGLLTTAIFAVGSSVYLARRTQKRIDNISNTLAAVSSGHLDRRVPPASGDGDDIDEIAGNLNAMLDQLQKLVENVNQVSTDIAHDLKKPMTRLRNRLEAAQDSAALPDDIRRQLDEALELTDSIVATFDAMLKIGQLQAGERKSQFTTTDLGHVVAHVIEAYEPVIQDSGFFLTAAQPFPKIEIHGDGELLTQMLANLIDNALHHCPKGTLITLVLSNNPAPQLTIADNGPGIPEAERDNVFRRFYRLERARSTPGHGLGLSVVSAIAELHGASITLADNQPGLRVQVLFPPLKARDYDA